MGGLSVPCVGGHAVWRLAVLLLLLSLLGIGQGLCGRPRRQPCCSLGWPLLWALPAGVRGEGALRLAAVGCLLLLLLHQHSCLRLGLGLLHCRDEGRGSGALHLGWSIGRGHAHLRTRQLCHA